MLEYVDSLRFCDLRQVALPKKWNPVQYFKTHWQFNRINVDVRHNGNWGTNNHSNNLDKNYDKLEPQSRIFYWYCY